MEKFDTQNKVIFGFWVYLMTDLIMFAVLFATFAVLRGNTYGGLPLSSLFSLPLVLKETLILLTSSFTCGLSLLAVNHENTKQTIGWLLVTFGLGVSFLVLELSEFSHLIAEGHSFQTNAALSSYFSLVGTHGLHIAVGLLWLLVALIQIWVKGLSPHIASKLTRFSLFWHFLDVIWIFIFTIVYLVPLK
ncbi:MAG TPA: cytochrome o ubiquinol oxidase subunit III [Methylomirabilota bacterium]|jgi:cytochrome o ubiquinol oxidase subunit 3|nr:cytochrome o ubiquinol oxidase subunit III [Methylomirabilota bacterium]